jgi:hypothetical protein
LRGEPCARIAAEPGASNPRPARIDDETARPALLRRKRREPFVL